MMRRLFDRRSVAVSSGMLLAVAAWVAPLGAQITVVNPGFEDISGETPSNEFTFGRLLGWDLYDPSNITSGGAGPTYYLGTLTPFEPDPVGAPGVFSFFPDGAPEGQRVGIAFSFEGSGGEGEWGFVQELDAVLEADTTYTLRVGIGNIASGDSMASGFFPLDGFPGYRVDLLAGVDLPGGGTVIAQDDNSLAGLIDDGEFADSVVQLTTDAAHPQLGQTLGIRLVNLNLVDPAFPDSDLEVDFDDVRLDAVPAVVAVPAVSPSSLAVLAAALTGGAALVLRRRAAETSGR